MKVHFSLRSAFLLAFVVFGFAAAQVKSPVPGEFIAWLPVSDAERALKAPMVEKDAGAEILLWHVHVVDERQGQDLQRIIYHYVRVKVFDEKGKEKAATVDLTYREPGDIVAVSGRTIKLDGSVVELDPKSVLRRVVARVGHSSEKAVSFALPGVEPGAIVEYRWKQFEDDNRFRYLRLHFQRDLPVERVTYYLKPLAADDANEQMFVHPFHCRPSKPELDREGWQEISVENLPAFHSEPYAPSDPNLEQWALLFYRPAEAKANPDKYWMEQGRQLYKRMKDALKVSPEMKTGADQALAAAKTDEEKVAAVAAWLRQKIRSIADPSVTSAEREAYFKKLPKNRDRNSAEIFESGLAVPSEMNTVFVGLASAAGMDARLVLLSSRLDVEFNPKTMTDSYFLDHRAAAVKIGEKWKFVDASRARITPGALPWDEEDVWALVSDAKEPFFVKTLASTPEASIDEHAGHLKLSEDGSISGDVTERYTGHRAEEYRDEIADLPAAQREDWFRDRLLHAFPGAELSDLKIENADDASQPLRVKFHLSASGFAEVAGKRVLFQPNVFRRAQPALFSESERRSVVQFPYAWKEIDRLRIDLPQGYSLDHADSPGNLQFGTGSYSLGMVISKAATTTLVVDRDFTFGANGSLYFAPDNYPTLKKVFDEVHIRDTHSLALKAE
jgi:Domain of Unknown Function with PDB structure (DUF3857)